MKTLRQILLLAVMLVASSAMAQENDPVILAIRGAYQQAKENIKRNDKSKQTRNDMVTTMRYQVPGSGPTTETLHFFFNLELFGDANQYSNYSLFFVTRQYNIAARKYYEEYLYNNDGRLIFAFKQDYDAAGKKYEKRLYYKDGSFYTAVGGPLNAYEEETTIYLAQDYRHAFDNLIRNAKE